MLFWYLRISRRATVPGLPACSHHSTKRTERKRAGELQGKFPKKILNTRGVESMQTDWIRGECKILP